MTIDTKTLRALAEAASKPRRTCSDPQSCNCNEKPKHMQMFHNAFDPGTCNAMLDEIERYRHEFVHEDVLQDMAMDELTQRRRAEAAEAQCQAWKAAAEVMADLYELDLTISADAYVARLLKAARALEQGGLFAMAERVGTPPTGVLAVPGLTEGES